MVINDWLRRYLLNTDTLLSIVSIVILGVISYVVDVLRNNLAAADLFVTIVGVTFLLLTLFVEWRVRVRFYRRCREIFDRIDASNAEIRELLKQVRKTAE